MKQNRHVLIGAALIVVLGALGIAERMLERTAAAQAGATVQAPRFEADPFWPKPLPHHWLLGSTIGVSVDAQDHVWIVHRGAATLNARTEMSAATDRRRAKACCGPGPPALGFDPGGNLGGHWGGPAEGYEWPESNHGI